jgi:hypothetical protein
MKEAKEEMLLMNRLQGNVSQTIDDETKNFFKRGGKIKSIYEASTNFKFEKDGEWVSVTKNDLIDLCEKFESEGEKIRLSNKVAQNMAIFDRRIVFISLVDELKPRNKRTDIIIRNKDYAENMVSLFELNWENAETIEDFKKKLNN